jgi:uncharacterized protein (UPF0332 family)
MNAEKAELVGLKIANAKKLIHEVEILIENQLWNTAVNRLYYACFHAVSALLHNYDLDAKTHSGVQRMLSLHFIKTGIIDRAHGELYTILMDMRQGADYEDEVEYQQEDVMNLLPPAIDLVHAVEIVMHNT